MNKLFLFGVISTAWLIYLSKPDIKQANLEKISPVQIESIQEHRERGVVVPYDKQAIRLGSPGNILFIVENNSRVKKGDLLVSIDNSSILLKIKQLERELKSLKQSRDLHLSKMDYRKKRYQEVIDSAERRYQHALKSYEYEKAKPHKDRLEILSINQELAEIELENSKYIESLEKRLFDKGFISPTAFDRVVRDRKMDREKLNQTLAETAAEKKGTPKELLEEEKIKVERLEIELQQKREQLIRSIDEHKNKLDELNASMEAKQIEIDHNKETSLNSKAHAPSDGIVILRKKRDFSAGGIYVPYAQGRGVREDTIVADIIDPKKMEVHCLVNESDYHKLKPGMEAHLEFDAYPNSTETAKISLISGVGQDRNIWLPAQDGPSEVYLFNTILKLPRPSVQLYPNMSVDITFKLKQNTKQLIIPRRAIIWKNKTAHIMNKHEEITAIEGYAIDSMNYVVTSGLDAEQDIWIKKGM